MKELIYIGFAYKHHKNRKGGYHHIQEYLNYDYAINCQKEHELWNYPSNNRIIKIMVRLYTRIAGFKTTWPVLRCIFFAILRQNQVFHFIYAENTYKWLHYFKGKSNKIVCTFHQPIDFFEKRTNWLTNLKKIDQIILMSDENIDRFKTITGRDNVHFIPHGINTTFYSPGLHKKERHILMVGNWLREFEFANSIFKRLLRQQQDLKITVVTNKSNFDYFTPNDRLILLSDIDDEYLRDLYRTAHCLFLPLKYFTANNAILEAISCGCPVVISSNNLNTSYFKEDQVTYLRLNPEEAFDYLNCLIDEAFDFQKARIGREFVCSHFSWPVIANRTNSLLKEA